MVVGLLPAAGFGQRLPDASSSKEILLLDDGEPVIAHALRAFARADIRDVVVVIRPEKSDIVRRLGDGTEWGVRLSFVETGPTAGPAHTIDKAYDIVGQSTVALAFPDIVMATANPFANLTRQWAPEYPGILGLFPTTPTQPADPVFLGPEGDVSRIASKDESGTSPHSWGIAMWRSPVTEFIHQAVCQPAKSTPTAPEWTIGAVLDGAIRAGNRFQATPVSTQAFLDVGTPRGLSWARAGNRAPPPAGPSTRQEVESD